MTDDKEKTGAKVADAEAKSAKDQAAVEAVKGASSKTEEKVLAEAGESGADNATGIPESILPNTATKLPGQQVAVPTGTKARKSVGIARRTAVAWWCDNCDTANQLGDLECHGCGGTAKDAINK